MKNKLTGFIGRLRRPKARGWLDDDLPELTADRAVPDQVDAAAAPAGREERAAQPDIDALVPRRQSRLAGKFAARREARQERMGGPGPEYLTIVAPEDLGAVTGRRLLVCGHGLFASLHPNAARPSDGFVDQPPRRASTQLHALKSKGRGPRLYIAVDERLLHQPKARYALALDYYLRWGLAHAKGDVVLLGGAEAGGTSYIDALVFSGGQLTDLFEHELPASDDREFIPSLKVLLKKLHDAYPTAKILASAPLPDWKQDGIEYLGQKPLKGLTFKPLGSRGEAATGVRAAVVIGVLGLCAYGAQLALGWRAYTEAGLAYEEAVTDPVLAKAGGISNARLELLQQREFYMQEQRPQEALAKRSSQIVAGIAGLPGVRIASITFATRKTAQAAMAGEVSAPGDPSTALEPDVAMELLVQQSADSALRDAEALMTAISARTGMRLRLKKAQGWSTEESTGVRKLAIEGFTE
ncbi:TPA: hypothetical protein ACOFEQ_002517 [Stenotrophomonas maltophilia]|nr:hypothetical protein [Stenotrophomonas maltophilia]